VIADKGFARVPGTGRTGAAAGRIPARAKRLQLRTEFASIFTARYSLNND
jgi:hypothetical protein